MSRHVGKKFYASGFTSNNMGIEERERGSVVPHIISLSRVGSMSILRLIIFANHAPFHSHRAPPLGLLRPYGSCCGHRPRNHQKRGVQGFAEAGERNQGMLTGFAS